MGVQDAIQEFIVDRYMDEEKRWLEENPEIPPEPEVVAPPPPRGRARIVKPVEKPADAPMEFVDWVEPPVEECSVPVEPPKPRGRARIVKPGEAPKSEQDKFVDWVPPPPEECEAPEQKVATPPPIPRGRARIVKPTQEQQEAERQSPPSLRRPAPVKKAKAPTKKPPSAAPAKKPTKPKPVRGKIVSHRIPKFDAQSKVDTGKGEPRRAISRPTKKTTAKTARAKSMPRQNVNTYNVGSDVISPVIRESLERALNANFNPVPADEAAAGGSGQVDAEVLATYEVPPEAPPEQAVKQVLSGKVKALPTNIIIIITTPEGEEHVIHAPVAGLAEVPSPSGAKRVITCRIPMVIKGDTTAPTGLVIQPRTNAKPKRTASEPSTKRAPSRDVKPKVDTRNRRVTGRKQYIPGGSMNFPTDPIKAQARVSTRRSTSRTSSRGPSVVPHQEAPVQGQPEVPYAKAGPSGLCRPPPEVPQIRVFDPDDSYWDDTPESLDLNKLYPERYLSDDEYDQIDDECEIVEEVAPQVEVVPQKKTSARTASKRVSTARSDRGANIRRNVSARVDTRNPRATGPKAYIPGGSMNMPTKPIIGKSRIDTRNPRKPATSRVGSREPAKSAPPLQAQGIPYAKAGPSGLCRPPPEVPRVREFDPDDSYWDDTPVELLDLDQMIAERYGAGTDSPMADEIDTRGHPPPICAPASRSSKIPKPRASSCSVPTRRIQSVQSKIDTRNRRPTGPKQYIPGGSMNLPTVPIRATSKVDTRNTRMTGPKQYIPGGSMNFPTDPIRAQSKVDTRNTSRAAPARSTRSVSQNIRSVPIVAKHKVDTRNTRKTGMPQYWGGGSCNINDVSGFSKATSRVDSGRSRSRGDNVAGNKKKRKSLGRKLPSIREEPALIQIGVPKRKISTPVSTQAKSLIHAPPGRQARQRAIEARSQAASEVLRRMESLPALPPRPITNIRLKGACTTAQEHAKVPNDFR